MFKFIQKTFVFSLFFSFLIQANSAEIIPLSGNRVANFSQGLLDAHIKMKLENGADPRTLEFCFLKVKENNKETLEFYGKRCPNEGLEEFRETAKKLNVFELSQSIKSRAAEEWEDLKNKYSSLLSKVDQSEVRTLNEDVKTDSLGQLVFMKLKGKSVNVGHITADNQLMDLCSASWQNICYFDGSVFKLGQETREEVYIEGEGENTPQPFPWEWPRKYYDFEDVLGAAVFTRGNDDSRDQVVYYFKAPRSGHKVPITEEWYLYFHLNPQTRHLVEMGLNEDGKPLTTHRTRREWNYMTAIHPLHVFKTRNRETGESGVRLYMGASVVYDSSLNIEDSDCDMSETEGFMLVASKDLQGKAPVAQGTFLTSFERGVLLANLESIYEQKLGDFFKADSARYSRHHNPDNTPSDRNHKKYLPHYQDVEGVKVFGMNAEASLDKRATDQSIVVLKNSWFELNDPSLDPNSYEASFLASQNNYNMIKEFINIEKKSDSEVALTLAGFNPNELVANNPASLALEKGKYKVSVDPQAVYQVWDSKNTQLGSSHTISRPLAIRLQKIKYALNAAYYVSVRQGNAPLRENIDVLAQALEKGEELQEEERDTFLRRLDSMSRFVGKNMGMSFAVKGRSNHLQSMTYLMGTLSQEMYAPNWVFPSHFAIEYYPPTSSESEESVPEWKLVEVKKEDMDYYLNFVNEYRGETEPARVILLDHEKVIKEIESNPHFFSKYVQDNQTLGRVVKSLQEADSYEGYFRLFADYDKSFKRLAAATREQMRAFGAILPDSLKPYAIFTRRNLENINRSKLYKDTNECFVAAGVNIEKHLVCREKYNLLKAEFNQKMTDAGIPLEWQLEGN